MESSKAFLLVTILVIALCMTGTESRKLPVSKDSKCPGELVYNTCGGCQGVCGDTRPMPCSRMCHRGCFCPGRGLLLTKKDSAECVPVEKCPANSLGDITSNVLE